MNKGYLVALTAGAVMLAGCANLYCLNHCSRHTRNSSSVVEFLYPDGQLPPRSAGFPQLTIPLRVGLAFLPSSGEQATGLDEAHKQAPLERVKQRFASRKFVADIVLVPDYYLTGQRGFTGLDGVRRLYGIDVMALVSFDQETHLDANDWSLAYLTIVGAYVVKGSRHDVSTLVDLAVIDPQTRQLIIRAGGTDLRHGNSTLPDAERNTREATVAGFSAATDQMIDHFDTALTQFQADVRSGTAPVRVVSGHGMTNKGGGGAIGGGLIGMLLLSLARRARSHRGEAIS